MYKHFNEYVILLGLAASVLGRSGGGNGQEHHIVFYTHSCILAKSYYRDCVILCVFVCVRVCVWMIYGVGRNISTPDNRALPH